MSVDFTGSELLHPVPHAFFTRRGGVSKGLFAGLNCGTRSGDDPDHVSENRRLATERMGTAFDSLVTLRQTHSTKVAAIRQLPADCTEEADALVTAMPGVAVGVLTADCQPVLLADHRANVVAAVHAGWVGALGGIIENAVAGMEEMGASRTEITAVIGPAISGRNYEVGLEFRERFLAEDPASDGHFHRDRFGKLRFDLPAYGISRLNRCGVQRTEWVGHCTYADPERYYSYRRSRHRSESSFGLLLSAIACPGT